MLENELQKQSLNLRNIPEPLYQRTRYLSICNRQTISGLRKRTQKNPNRKLQETSHHSRKQSSIGEEITYGQTVFLDDLRLFQN